jgi:glycosyltransferase involved in cell wall biosynthesis
MRKVAEKMTVDFFVVIPVFNEEENISELYGRLTAQMEKLGEYEIIMVDDGSSDGSWELIKELHEGDSRVKGLSFSRNFGHHIAL